MKRHCITTIGTIVLLLITIGCTSRGKGSGRQPQPSDTIYTIETINNTFANDPEQALQIIDSAEALGNISKDEASFLRARNYSMSLVAHRYDTSVLICEALMASDFVENPTNREFVLDLLVYSTRHLDDYGQYLRWATEKAEFCRQQGNEVEMMRTQSEIGFVLVRLGETEKGLSMLNGTIAALDNQRHFNQMDACIIALKRKINALILLDRNDEIIPLAQRIIELTDDYRSNSDIYNDNSTRMPVGETKIKEYCDFYSAQAHSMIANAFAYIGQKDSAHHHLNLYKQNSLYQTQKGRTAIGPTLCMLGDYDEMTAIYDEAEKNMGGDTINDDYATILKGRATAANARGNYKSASEYWSRYANLNDRINKSLQTSQALELATRYHLEEARLTAEMERDKARQSRQQSILFLTLVVAAIAVIGRLLVQRQAIKRKNKVLAEQIAETVKYKQFYDATKNSTKPIDLESLSSDLLFEYLSDTIRHEKLYLNPECGRQTLIDRFHISDRRIGAAFAQSSYSSLPEFIRELRLEHACQLLVDNPEMSIGDVATASGFSSLTVFGRDFKRKYEVTPTYYKSTAQKHKKEE